MEVELLRACVSCGDEKSLGKKTEAAAIMLMQSTESTTFQSAQEYREALGALSRFMAIRRRSVSGEWSPAGILACAGSPRRGDRGVCGFQPPRLWEWFVGIDLGVFPRVSVG